jgi:7-carboxy-7-deazaguanine synthase
MSEGRYAVAEIFDSVQGEGLWAGTAMTFIRLAGCHVGGPRGACRFADGRSFQCDTDYKARLTLAADELAARTRHHHVCITGGEPLDQNLISLLGALRGRQRHIHLETSGTREAPEGIDWLTVSPKEGCLDSMLRRAHQVKLLVDDRFSPELWRERLARAESKALVYLQAINGVGDLHRENMSRTFDLTQLIPDWRLSVQLHKVLRVR